MTLSSIRQANDEKGNTFLIVHAKFTELDPNQASYPVQSPGSFVVYNHPVFDQDHHHYTGNAIEPSGVGTSLPHKDASAFLDLDTGMSPGEVREGDIVFNIPSKHDTLVLVWLPSAEQFAWTY